MTEFKGRFAIVDMSPERAQKILDRNEGNRNLRPAQVKHISDAIKSGNWKVTHQPIAIAKSGRLLDGQHRLCAIVASGMTVKIPAVYDVDEDTFDAIDIGIRRTLADTYALNSRAVSIVTLIGDLHNGWSAGFVKMPSKFEPYKNVFMEYAERQLSEVPTQIAVVSSVPIRAAVTLHMALGTGGDYAIKQHYLMTTRQFTKLEPFPASFCARLLGGAKMTRPQLFELAYMAMDESKSERTSARLSNFGVTSAKLRLDITDFMKKRGYAKPA